MKNSKNAAVLKIGVAVGLLVIIIVICIHVNMVRTRSNDNGVPITGRIIDNDYHNYLAGTNVVRVGDAVYCSYAKNTHTDYGIIEITEEGSRRIFWEGNNMLDAMYAPPKICGYDGKLLMYTENTEASPFSEGVVYYSSSEECFKAFEGINGIALTSLDFQNKGDLLVCGVSENEDGIDRRSLNWYYKEERGAIESSHVFEYCLGDLTIFYTVQDQALRTCIREYNVESKTDRLVWTAPESMMIVSFLTVDTEYVLINTNKGIYKVFLTPDVTVQKIVDDSNSACVYEDMVYVATDNAVNCYNLTTDTYQELVNKAADECYVFDDRWVYFGVHGDLKRPEELYRVKQDGMSCEKVFE